MKRIAAFILASIMVVSLTGCLTGGRSASSGNGDSFLELLSPENEAKTVNPAVVKSIPKGMKYYDIIKRLGKTKDVGSGLHVAKYVVDGDRALLISFPGPDEVCPTSGEDMLKNLVPLSDSNGLGSKEANALIAGGKPGSSPAPIFDGSSGKQIGEAYSGFALPIDAQRDGKAWFNLAISDPSSPDKIETKSFYIPINYMSKGYIEPFAVIEIISLDSIFLNEKAPIYNSNDKPLVIFYDKFGPVKYIQKTDKGYQLVIGMNLVYMKEKDITVIKHK